MGEGGAKESHTYRLIEVTLDETSIGRNAPDIEHERKVAIFDLLEKNYFELDDRPAGPYTLHISIAENRLVFAVSDSDAEPLMSFLLSLSPFRRLVKDYFIMVDSYHQAIRTAPPSRSRIASSSAPPSWSTWRARRSNTRTSDRHCASCSPPATSRSIPSNACCSR